MFPLKSALRKQEPIPLSPFQKQLGISAAQAQAWSGELKKILSKHALFHESPKSRELIEKAFWFAVKKHQGQTRQTGEPYIIHPIATAATAAEYGSDTQTVCASLLHDVIEDCGVTHDEIEQLFGEEDAEKTFAKNVSQIVGLVSKPKLVNGKWVYSHEKQYCLPGDLYSAEKADKLRELRLQKMYKRLHETGDARAIFTKLFDNKNNMETISAVPEHKKEGNIGAAIKHNLWIAEKTKDPSLYMQMKNAIIRGLTDPAFKERWTKKRVLEEIEKNRRVRKYPANRIVNLSKLFDEKYFYKVDYPAGAQKNRIIVYQTREKPSRRIIRVPKKGFFNFIFRTKIAQKLLPYLPWSVAESRRKFEEKKINSLLDAFKKQGLDVVPEENPFPITLQRAYLFKLNQDNKELRNKKLIEKLERIEKIRR